VFEQAVAREALRLAFAQHREFAVAPQGGLQSRGIGDMFRQRGGPQSLVDPLRLDLLVASGGVLSHAPRMIQTAAMLIDAFEPAGFTRLAKDSIFMMPHLGVLASVHRQAALEVFERDCLVWLGDCVAASGQGRWGEPCFDFQLEHPEGRLTGALRVGEMQRIPLGPGQSAQIEVRPSAGFDLGGGAGQAQRRVVHGGTVGLILDARGRPLRLAHERGDGRNPVAGWCHALDLYPGLPAGSGRQS